MHFDEESQKWDTKYRVQRAKKISTEIENYLDKNNNLKALEFGCGTGLISENLTHRFSDILMMDLSEGMIEQLKLKIEKNEIKNMKTWCGDLFQFNDNEKFDVIYTSMVFHHIEDLPKVTKKLHELLNKDGKLVVVDLCPDDGGFHDEVQDFSGHNGFKLTEMERLIEEAGLEVIGSKIFYSGMKKSEGKEQPYQLFSMCGIRK
ncbi:MAG: class I SAM-dependent methyltransferase [Clostridium sulfidigenes]|uniref:Class I SAM-dependent methyltransferase n=1 Tax=Clostridium sulfidigenes TaxID=318464 RepID=A0A927W5K7_9CLOT|nr:class I SAM-dependent methyltransferase [Clostridium sulfidigenes]